ncbi:ABC transporter ATP-binding protein [Clostridium sp. KNHs205]|uniref:ABC transporter ATP-binding protein n=1 Tax=Clostridium sp. KNHs205 TaxID=1449050 RepID=UPI00051B7BB5|nr:ABC transporter ATP-binding protein [Clostridium sp. KNHs205]
MKLSIKKYGTLLAKYMKNSRLHLVLLALVLAVSIILQLVNPMIISFFIDGIEMNKSMELLIKAAILFILAAFTQQLLAIASTYLSQNIGWRTTNTLRRDLVKHCLGLDMNYFKEHQSGELVERIDGDVNALFNFFSKLFIGFANNILLMTGVVVVLSLQNPLIGAAFVLFLVLSFIILGKTQGDAVDNFGKERELSSKLYGFLGEHLDCTEEIKASGAGSYVSQRFMELLRKWLPIQLKAYLSGYKIWIIMSGLFGLGDIMIFAVGGYLWYKGHISLGLVYLMLNYFQLLESPLDQLKEQMLDIQKATASIIRIEELLNQSSSISDKGTIKLSEKNISLSFDQVCFSYEKEVPVLKDISFELPAGKVLGILGHTGCGKTTLARLVVRFYEPDSGNICFNGKKQEDILLKDLRSSIAYVTQEVQLFYASVRDNITFFNKDISDDEIIATIYKMGLKDWFENIKEGLDTILEPGGGMSSGEAQLLTLVRVFLRDPKLIILDEASARLDPVTERFLEQALSTLIEGRACIIIAHRLSTVQRADNILILDKGEILEYGLREELISKKDSRLNELLNYGIEEVLA